MSVFDLAILAEHEYRRERLARAYQRGTPRVVTALGRWARATQRRVRDGFAARRYAKAADVAARDADTTSRARHAAERLGATLDAFSARTDRTAWDAQVTRRTAEIADAMSALRPQDGAGRRAA
ncbi:hypothetical protein [Isoptericola hypogeus]